jgi:hypothetical protein
VVEELFMSNQKSRRAEKKSQKPGAVQKRKQTEHPQEQGPKPDKHGGSGAGRQQGGSGAGRERG